MDKKTTERPLVDFAVTARKYKTTLTQKFMNRPIWTKPVAGEVRSTLPGTVVSLAVKEGDSVKEGDLLLVHEAMKMRNRILSPCIRNCYGNSRKRGRTFGERCAYNGYKRRLK